MNTNNSLSIPTFAELEPNSNILEIPKMSDKTTNSTEEKPKKRKRKTGKVITLDEEPEISFEIDESQPDDTPTSSMSSVLSVKDEIKDNSEDLPEEQSGNITF